ncbi:hypothetical protein EC968_000545 [Mortierella alpina]|nr:hypothetical protein EC968_000545 [Mortierella alpina]
MLSQDTTNFTGTLQLEFHSLFVGFSAITLNSMKAANWQKLIAKKTLQEVIDHFVRALVKYGDPVLCAHGELKEVSDAPGKILSATHQRESSADGYLDQLLEPSRAISGPGCFSINQEMTAEIGAALEDLARVIHFCPGEADHA